MRTIYIQVWELRQLALNLL